MPEYRRKRIEGGTYFFTVVTYQRRPILTSVPARRILHNAWVDTKRRFPFENLAVCLLPDHLHCIWKLPEGDTNYSIRWKEIKRLFTKSYLMEVGPGGERDESRVKRNEAAIWQRRFWEHTIEDEVDLEVHFDYIHYNPIKHGLVESISDWQWSSFHRYVNEGYYDNDWVGGDEGRNLNLSYD
ncbi:MAG: REP-associated tyrosine transposase [Anaerolineaceae bacterium]